MSNFSSDLGSAPCNSRTLPDIRVNADCQLENTSPVARVIKGSFDQGDKRFGGNAGRQCVTNSLIAIMKSVLTNVLTWSTATLDDVLYEGNQLYTQLAREGKIKDPTGNGFIAINELQTVHRLWNVKMAIEYQDSTS